MAAGRPALVPGINTMAALDEVLISPDLAKRAPSLIGRLAAALRDNSAPDPPRYAEYFEGGSAKARAAGERG